MADDSKAPAFKRLPNVSQADWLRSKQTMTTSGRCPPSLAAERTALLFGCYRKGDANDPETYTLAVAAVLAEYAPDIVRHVTDPRTGLPSRQKFLPTVSEVREACQEIVDADSARARREASIEGHAAAARQEAEVRAGAPTKEEIEAKLGRPVFRRRVLTPQQVKNLRADGILK